MMKIKDLEAMSAEAERLLKEMGFSVDITIFDTATVCVTDDDWANSITELKLKHLPELLADPEGFITRHFRDQEGSIIRRSEALKLKKTENNVVPFHSGETTA